MSPGPSSSVLTVSPSTTSRASTPSATSRPRCVGSASARRPPSHSPTGKRRHPHAQLVLGRLAAVVGQQLAELRIELEQRPAGDARLARSRSFHLTVIVRPPSYGFTVASMTRDAAANAPRAGEESRSDDGQLARFRCSAARPSVSAREAARSASAIAAAPARRCGIDEGRRPSSSRLTRSRSIVADGLLVARRGRPWRGLATSSSATARRWTACTADPAGGRSATAFAQRRGPWPGAIESAAGTGANALRAAASAGGRSTSGCSTCCGGWRSSGVPRATARSSCRSAQRGRARQAHRDRAPRRRPALGDWSEPVPRSTGTGRLEPASTRIRTARAALADPAGRAARPHGTRAAIARTVADYAELSRQLNARRAGRSGAAQASDRVRVSQVRASRSGSGGRADPHGDGRTALTTGPAAGPGVPEPETAVLARQVPSPALPHRGRRQRRPRGARRARSASST